LKIEETTAVNKPFFDAKIVATNIGSRRIRGIVLSHVFARFAFLFAISAILLLPSLSVIQINQSAWAGTFPGPNGQIAFVRDIVDEDAELNEIYVMNSDGSEQTRLTDNNVNDYDPSWSPDGEKIAFVSNGGIYVMNADDGSDVTRLTDNAADDRFPSWSPDGEKIAFQRDFGEIYVMNADDGSDVTRLTDDPAFDGQPSWSPDGEKISFVSGRNDPNGEEGSEIYVMNADDGSDVTRLTFNDLINDITPDWGTNTSPPGNGDDGIPTPAEQAIDEAVSIMENLDNIPQSIKTNLIALLEEISNDDSPNND
jgi:tricorn protease-like protein